MFETWRKICRQLARVNNVISVELVNAEYLAANMARAIGSMVRP